MIASLLRWAILAPLSFVMDFAGLFIVPTALLFCNRDSVSLPAWAWPWGNDRETINGDPYWQAQYGEAARSFWRRFLWLAVRNPANNYGYWCGWLQAENTVYQHWGDPTIGNKVGRAGWLWVVGDNQSSIGWCLYMVYPTLPGRCVRLMLGWKIHDMPKDNTRAQIVLMVNPLMQFGPDAV